MRLIPRILCRLIIDMSTEGIIQKVTGSVFMISILSAPLIYPNMAHADVLSDRLGDITRAQDEGSLISALVGLAIPVAVMALVGLSAYAGFLMITSQGNPEKLSEAREVITNALMGFGLIALSVAILLIIQSIVNLPGVNP